MNFAVKNSRISSRLVFYWASLCTIVKLANSGAQIRYLCYMHHICHTTRNTLHTHDNCSISHAQTFVDRAPLWFEDDVAITTSSSLSITLSTMFGAIGMTVPLIIPPKARAISAMPHTETRPKPSTRRHRLHFFLPYTRLRGYMRLVHSVC